MYKIQKSLFCSLFLLVIACDGAIEPLNEPLNPEATMLVFPEDNTECNTGVAISDDLSSVNFQWGESENTDVYEVIVKELESDIEIRIETNTNEADITIKKATPYQWQVVSKSNTIDITANSEIWRFYNSGDGIVNYAPFPADIVEPSLGSNLDSNLTNVTLEWTGSDVDNDIEGYEVYFDTNDPPVNNLGQTTSSSMNVSVSSGSTYYWMIKSTDEANNISESEVFWFRVE